MKTKSGIDRFICIWYSYFLRNCFFYLRLCYMRTKIQAIAQRCVFKKDLLINFKKFTRNTYVGVSHLIKLYAQGENLATL